jgi:hypothetical protein
MRSSQLAERLPPNTRAVEVGGESDQQLADAIADSQQRRPELCIQVER